MAVREGVAGIQILYASQTGTAEDVSSLICRMALRKGFKNVKVSSMDEYEVTDLVDEKLVVFVASTTGDGEEPDNMKGFWKFLLRKKLGPLSLQGLSFAVFGLGDSSYPKFNWVGKKLYRRLLQIGAEALLPRGDGDDQHPQGLDGALQPWLKDLWFNIYRRFDCSQLVPIHQQTLLPAKYRMIPENQEQEEEESNDRKRGDFVIVANDRITPEDHFQDVRSVVLEPASESARTMLNSCDPGDIVQIHGRCRAEDVEALVQRMAWSDIVDKRFRVEGQRSDARVLERVVYSLREILTELVDIWSCPQRSFVEWISNFASDPVEREKLLYFSGEADGFEDWTNYSVRVKRTIPEILDDFPSVRIPYQYVFDVFGRNRARSFSISNIVSNRQQLELTIAIVDYQTRIRARRQGFFTRWLRDLSNGYEVAGVEFRKATLRIPMDKPVILVASGTGIAPFRFFLNRRKAHYLEKNKKKKNGDDDDSEYTLHEPETWLFFGCRNEEKDCHHVTELRSHQAVNLVIAASRDSDQKIYVQDRMVEPRYSEQLHRLLFQPDESRAASIFIAGNVKLPDGVMGALKTILNRHEPNVNDSNVINEWKRTGRIQWESW